MDSWKSHLQSATTSRRNSLRSARAGITNIPTQPSICRTSRPTLLRNVTSAAVRITGNQLATYSYAQDTWRIRPNLTLNLGVRYEYTTVPVGEQAQSLNVVSGLSYRANGTSIFEEPINQSGGITFTGGYKLVPPTARGSG